MRELYHYCSNQKCFSILSNKTIRMSDIQKSNDFKELSLFFPEIFDCMESLYQQSPFRFKYDNKVDDDAFYAILDSSYRYWKKRFSSGDFSNFVLCFSEASDSLSQWRGYADNGKGCCLGFHFEDIDAYCKSTKGVLRLEKVTYLERIGIDRVIRDTAVQILSELKGLRKWIVTEMTHNDEDPDTDGLLHFNFDGMLERAFIDSLKYKSYDFHEEREWRLFLSNCAYKNPEWIDNCVTDKFNGPQGFQDTLLFLNNRVKFHVTEDDLVPFCSIRFSDISSDPVSSLWIGPKNQIRQSDLNLFLRLNGYNSTQMIRSRITYH